MKDLEKQPFQLVLSGPRICLIRSEPKLANLLWQTILRDRQLRGNSWQWLESEEQLHKYLVQRSVDIHVHDVVYIIKKVDDVIGTFHIHTFNYQDHKTEVGYAIEKNFEGFGYISEALNLVEAELKRLNFNKVIINCDTENIRSIRLAERNGYFREGTFIQDCVENGLFRDSAIFGKIL